MRRALSGLPARGYLFSTEVGTWGSRSLRQLAGHSAPTNRSKEHECWSPASFLLVLQLRTLVWLLQPAITESTFPHLPAQRFINPSLCCLLVSEQILHITLSSIQYCSSGSFLPSRWNICPSVSPNPSQLYHGRHCCLTPKPPNFFYSLCSLAPAPAFLPPSLPFLQAA